MRIHLSIFLLAVGFLSLAQENLQNYTPSILFDKGDWEFKTFQNLYTQSKSFDSSGKKEDNANSQYFFTSINQFLYGLNDQINVGFDVWVKSSDNKGDVLSSSYGVTGFGPKVKIAPFKSIPRLSLQSSILFNLADDPEGSNGERYFLERNATLWLNQLFFDVPLNDKSQLFFQQAFWYRFTKDGSFEENNSLQTQTSVFYSYFATSRLTLYAMTEYFPTHYDSNDQVQKAKAFFSYFIQSGIGTKYQAIPNKLELELLYTNFWNGSQGEGAGQTFNIGIRLINQ